MANNMNTVFNGIGTYSYTVPEAGIYSVSGKCDIPTLVNGGGASSLVVTINQNGSGKYTGNAGANGFYTTLSCAANDIIAVVTSSSSSNDTAYNAVKTKIAISTGE